MASVGDQRFLVIGFGNPGRLDDGLGPAAAKELEAVKLPGVFVDSNYQLQVEDAEAAAKYDVVLFVDAAIDGQEPFYVREVEPVANVSFTTHSLSPQAVLGLARELFGAKTRGFVVGIRGYEFDAFGERLSERACLNLKAATSYLIEVLKTRTLAPLLERQQRPSEHGADAMTY